MEYVILGLAVVAAVSPIYFFLYKIEHRLTALEHRLTWIDYELEGICS